MRQTVYLLPLLLIGCASTASSEAQRLTFSDQQFTMLGLAISRSDTKWIVDPDATEPITVGYCNAGLWGAPYAVITKTPLGPANLTGTSSLPATEGDRKAD